MWTEATQLLVWSANQTDYGYICRMAQKSLQERGLAVLSTSRFLLVAVWGTALSSISSSQRFQEELDKGTDPANISTFYDMMSTFTSAAMIGTWVITGFWLKQATEQTLAAGRQTRLSPRWAFWSWIVPVVSLWFPRRMIADVLPANAENFKPNELNTWWLTFLGFLIINDYGLVLTLQSASENPINPQYDIAGACMLTASYFVWKKIVALISA